MQLLCADCVPNTPQKSLGKVDAYHKRTVRPSGEMRSVSWQRCSQTAMHPQRDLCWGLYRLGRWETPEANLRSSNPLTKEKAKRKRREVVILARQTGQGSRA